jgi:hypothetical protein
VGDAADAAATNGLLPPMGRCHQWAAATNTGIWCQLVFNQSITRAMQ